MHHAFDTNEGSLLLPRGWAAKSQIVIHQDEQDGSLVMTFAPIEDGFDEALSLAGRALQDFTILDRRSIELERLAGEFAEITFKTQAESLHQLVVRLDLGGGRAVTFHATSRAPMPSPMRQALLQSIASFQHRPA